MARILRRFKIAEISGVDMPACEGCRAVIMKNHIEPKKDIKMSTEFSKAEHGHRAYDAMVEAAEEYRKRAPHLSEAQAFAAIYEDPDNIEFVKAERAAFGFRDDTLVAKAMPQVESLDPQVEQNMALGKLKEMAQKFRESHPEYTPEQAFAKVYTDPANLNLQKRERQASRRNFGIDL